MNNIMSEGEGLELLNWLWFGTPIMHMMLGLSFAIHLHDVLLQVQGNSHPESGVDETSGIVLQASCNNDIHAK